VAPATVPTCIHWGHHPFPPPPPPLGYPLYLTCASATWQTPL